MSDALKQLFKDFDRGHLSRRQLLRALGIATVAGPVAAALRPVAALGQGRCADAGSSGPGCDQTPAKLPFDPTGWKTVALDRFTMQVADYEKEAAFFNAIVGWKVRSDDGKQAVLDIDDFGSMVIRGGYTPPPPPLPTNPPAGSAATAGAGASGAGAAGGRAATAGAGATGGGRGGGGGGRGGGRRYVVDSFCWGISPWDAKKVEAALKARGLSPVADHEGKDFQSFHVKAPGGFDVQISNANGKNRRQGEAKGKLLEASAIEPTGWKTVWLDHISYGCANYKDEAAFYKALLGWDLRPDEGSQNEAHIGDVGNIIIRRGSGIDHIAFGITPWDPDAVGAELVKRGLSHSIDTGGKGSKIEDLRVAPYQSYHTNSPSGFTLQISKTTRDVRDVR